MRYQCLRYREPTAIDFLGSMDMEDSGENMRLTFEIIISNFNMLMCCTERNNKSN